MKMLEVVRQLQKQGHKVEYYVRKDGGILIKRIDSQRFTTGASGNIMARSMVGVEISEARSAQLKYATRTRKALRRLRNINPEKALRDEWEKVHKKWNKAFKSKKGKPHGTGYFGWARVKYIYEKEGKEEAFRRIKEAEKYASGVAYEENVRQLVYFIQDYALKYSSSLLQELANDILDNMSSIRESWIKPAYDALYEVDHGVPVEQVVRNVRRILRLL